MDRIGIQDISRFRKAQGVKDTNVPSGLTKCHEIQQPGEKTG